MCQLQTDLNWISCYGLCVNKRVLVSVQWTRSWKNSLTSSRLHSARHHTVFIETLKIFYFQMWLYRTLTGNITSLIVNKLHKNSEKGFCVWHAVTCAGFFIRLFSSPQNNLLLLEFSDSQLKEFYIYIKQKRVLTDTEAGRSRPVVCVWSASALSVHGYHGDNETDITYNQKQRWGVLSVEGQFDRARF